uniref:SOSS complex subunit A homolog n=1 Tax=Branchiostoma floridae TaxID=7739 RepID=C3Y6Z8_BRAFL|eukprot:XP_002608098.1 hypothetical protein BRAFLDRAFT_126262 [Branchiostoma floridae]
MEPNQPPKTRLYEVGSLDPKDELEEVCKGMQEHEEITMGLLYSILVESTSAQKSLSDLTFITRDGLGLVLVKLNQLITDHFSKLLESVRTQVLWLTRELIKTSVAGTDGICLSLLKQIIGGDVSQKNVWLAEAVLDVLADNRPWLDKHPVLVSISVYTYLRLVEDHGGQGLAGIRQKEVDFCVTLLREKWTDCAVIGRDLIRLLQHVARIPEFERLWRDMITNPQTLSHQFTGLSQLMTLRTSRKFLACRLTPEMENKLHFITSKVRFGQQQRYQDWFQRQYLSTPESQSLRCDLIRYICGVIHPSNEILCSDIVPRWALIGWLLMSCKSNVAASNAKLSLFYDWLFYQPDKDSIMNIEPAILVMHHSLRSHPHITATLLDFLCRIIPNFFPPYEAQVRQGIHTSLRQILEKRVLPTGKSAHTRSLSPLFDNPKLDKDLRVMIRDKFSEFCTTTATTAATKVPVEEPLLVKPEVVLISSDNDKNNDREYVGEVAFSDDEEEEIGGKVHWKFRPIKEVDESTVDISDSLRQLSRDSELRDLVVQLQADSDISQDTEAQCEVVDKIVETILQMECQDNDISLLCYLVPFVYTQSFPRRFNRRAARRSESHRSPTCRTVSAFFRVFVVVISGLFTATSRLRLLNRFGRMFQPPAGPSAFYQWRVSSPVTRETGARFPTRSQEADGYLSSHGVSIIHYPSLPAGMQTGSVTSISRRFLLSWQTAIKTYAGPFMSHAAGDCRPRPHRIILTGAAIVYGSRAPSAERTQAPNAAMVDHSEALTNTLLMLKVERPTLEMVRYVMIRDCSEQDHFTTCILRQWSLDHEERLADLVKSMVFKFSSSTPTRKSKRSTSSRQPTPTTHQVLGHLDNLRQVCTPRQTFFGQEALLQALQHIQQSCSDMLKTKYSDLFALAEDFEDSSRPTRQKTRKVSNTSPKPTKRTAPREPDSSSESETEEVRSKPPKKKKKSSATVASDSD